MVLSDFTLESGYDAAQKLMEQAPDTDGIFCATDTIAIGAMQYLKGIGKRIPEDVAITGIGHSRMTEIIEPHRDHGAFVLQIHRHRGRGYAHQDDSDRH